MWVVLVVLKNYIYCTFAEFQEKCIWQYVKHLNKIFFHSKACFTVQMMSQENQSLPWSHYFSFYVWVKIKANGNACWNWNATKESGKWADGWNYYEEKI